MNPDRIIEQAAAYLNFTASMISLDKPGAGENLGNVARDLADLINSEPITEEWVFNYFPSKGEQYSARERPDCPGLIWQNRFERFTLFNTPLQLKTRGQVRLLVWALFRVTL